MTESKRASRKLLLGLLLLAVLATVYVIWGIQAGWELRTIWETPYFHLGEVAVTLKLIVGALVFLILLSLATGLARRFVGSEVLSRTELDPGQRYAIERTLGYAIFAMGLFIGMQMIGLNLNSLAFLGGALGIGIGFGLQNIASNFASGLILLLERPIKVGDRIEVGNLNGDVVRIGGRSTWVRTNDNLTIIVPNAEFTSSRVTNWTANDRRVRFSFPIGVAYRSDPQHVRQVLLAVAAQHPDVLQLPAPEVLLAGFGDSSIDFELRVWTTAQVQTPNRLRSDLYFELARQFAAQNIEIPFPQRDLYIKTMPQPVPPPSQQDASDAGGAAEDSS